MMKLQIEPDRAQHLKYTSHEKCTSASLRKKKGKKRERSVTSALIFGVYKAASRVQWKLHALYKDDPNP